MAACDNAAAVRFVGADAAADAVAARRPKASYENVAYGSGNSAEAASKKVADGTPVHNAEYGFAVIL